MIEQRYNLSMIPCGVNPIVRVSQYDDGSRTIVFNLTDNEYAIADAEVVIDGETVASSIVDGQIQFVVQAAQTALAGVHLGEVRLADVGSLNFRFYVDRTPLNIVSNTRNILMNNNPNIRQNSPIIDQNAFDLITERIDKADKTIEDINDILDGKKGDEKPIEEIKESEEEE